MLPLCRRPSAPRPGREGRDRCGVSPRAASTPASAPSAASPATPSAPPPPPPPPANPPGLEGVLLPADSPLRTSAAAYGALLTLSGGAARVKCGETALGRGLVVPRQPLPPVPATLPPLQQLRPPAGDDAAARAGAFRSPASAPTLAQPSVVITCTEDEEDDEEGGVGGGGGVDGGRYERLFDELAAAGGAATAASLGFGGGVGSGASSAAAQQKSDVTMTSMDDDFGFEDYTGGGTTSGSSGSSSSSNNNNSIGSSAGAPPVPPSTLRRGEVAVAVPLTSALVVTDEPLEGPSAVGDRQQAQWQIEHGTLPPALADFLQQAGARWDVRMAAWVLWLAAGAAADQQRRRAAGDGGAESSAAAPACSPLWSHYLSLMPTPDELCPLLMYGRSDLDDDGGVGGGGGAGAGAGGAAAAATTTTTATTEQRAARLLCPSNTPTAWLQLPSLIAEADSQREWSEYMHDAYFAPIGGSRVVSASAAAGAAARQLRALRNGRGLSPSRGASAWAQALVRSRSFSDDVGGEALTLMVPFADLANHTSGGGGGAATFHVSRDGRAFHLRALRACAARSELTIAYGERTPNDHLLRDYGFVVPANPYDRLDFRALVAEAGAASAAVAVGGSGNIVLPGGGGGGSSGSGSGVAHQPPIIVDPTLTLNAASLLEYAGFGGDPNNQQPDTVRPLPATLAAVAAAASSSAATTTTSPADALARRQRLVRRRCVLLSLPTRNVSPHAAAAGNPASALFAWASSAAAPPPPLPLRKRDAPAERKAAARLLAAVDARLASLPTSAQADEDLLREGRADVEGDGSLGGRARGGATRPLTPREATAVRARLEHKRLLQEARAVLRGYDAWLSQML